MGELMKCARTLLAFTVLTWLPFTAGASDAGPVWAVRGDHGTVYIAGSVHVLDDARSELPAGFDIAYADADELVMELDLDALDVADMQGYLLEHSTLADGRQLRDLFSPHRYERVAAGAQRLGLPLDRFQRLEPWAVALMLAQLELVRMGLDPENGVEQQLARRAQADRKPIGGLETLKDQLDVLDGLSYDDQARFLELSVDEAASGEMPDGIDALLSAWRTADTETLAELLMDEYDSFPSLYRPLVADRNRRWLPQIEQLLAKEHDTLVVVGALHLVGDDGLLELLARRGHRVSPLQTPALAAR